MANANSVKETGCCKKFNPEPWQDKTITWNNKLFVKDHVTSFFHIPLNFGKVVVKNMNRMKAAGADNPEQLMLCDEKSLFGSDIYIAVNKEAPNLKIEKISGTFITKVFSGNYKEIPSWIKEMQKFVESKGKKVKKLYFYYTMCPNCAKAYGQNYTVLVAEV